MDNGTVATLVAVAKAFQSNLSIMTLVARIVTNMCSGLVEVSSTDLVSVLLEAMWENQEDHELKLEGVRALACLAYRPEPEMADVCQVWCLRKGVKAKATWAIVGELQCTYSLASSTPRKANRRGGRDGGNNDIFMLLGVGVGVYFFFFAKGAYDMSLKSFFFDFCFAPLLCAEQYRSCTRICTP